jgi:hypothetical protein
MQKADVAGVLIRKIKNTRTSFEDVSSLQVLRPSTKACRFMTNAGITSGGTSEVIPCENLRGID